MSCVNVQYIDGDECIGASLPKINGNFASLSAAVCSLSSNVPDASINVVDSPTIDLNWNASTRTLSAVTTSIVATSSSSMVAKAWVIFNGTGTVSISGSYNVTSITDSGVGNYIVSLANGAMSTNNYIVLGYPEDATQNYKPGVLYFGPTNVRTVSSCQIYVLDEYATALWDSSRIQVIFYGGN